MDTLDLRVAGKLQAAARDAGLSLERAKLRRSSSRFCLGVEHGDYNGTELFGVGTDRFIWMAYAPNEDSRIRLLSLNYPDAGLVEFGTAETPPPRSSEFADSWARFPLGVVHVLRREGFELERGLTGVIFGDIPGGGMSRSASLTLNLMLSLLDVNGIEVEDRFRIVEMAQAVETDYIGSPCGQLDQIMILFARQGLGTYFRPQARDVEYVPLGSEAGDFRLVSLDTGTVRPGLEKSTYSIRRTECDAFAEFLRPRFGINALADVRDRELYDRIFREFSVEHPEWCARLKYIFHAQKRFYDMLAAWKRGDIPAVGRIFRADGIGLRDDYRISGPELESMCDIARTVEGVYGERMLGGGDKGAAGAIVDQAAVEPLCRAVDTAYPRSYPELHDRYALHSLRMVEGIREYPELGL
jgi:galactokinase